MTTDLLLFLILAVVSVVAAVSMLLSTNAVHSALFLVANFAAVSILYLLLNAPFIAMVQITVYAGAIMVLFLFVIMLLGAERLRRASGLAWQQRLALVLGAILLVEAGYLLFVRDGGMVFTPGGLPAVAEGFGSPQQIGQLLFTQYLLPFEVTSILLLVGMIGAIVLARDEKRP